MSATPSLTARLEWGLVPAVPVPFRGREIADDAQRAYAGWMAGQEIAGVAVWAHTGRGRHLTSEQRRAALSRLLSLNAPVADWPQMEEEIIQGHLA